MVALEDCPPHILGYEPAAEALEGEEIENAVFGNFLQPVMHEVGVDPFGPDQNGEAVALERPRCEDSVPRADILQEDVGGIEAFCLFKSDVVERYFLGGKGLSVLQAGVA